MSLHELTDQLPRIVYVNCEQKPKPTPNTELAQDRIDAAFQRKPRVSRNVAAYGDYRICQLNGMYTGNRGVISLKGPDGEHLQVTGLERTLIDIVVRPFYAGGVFEVLNAYRHARSKVDVPQLVEMFKALGYTYPYYQSIGFYMERAGYGIAELDLLRTFPLEYDFYLTFQMRNPSYSEKWRLFFPEGL
jgi:predicted transcriptional regulator of viral defense system